MAHSVKTQDDTAQIEVPAKPARKVVRAGLSVTVWLARGSYTFLSSAFVAGVLIQVFFAGMGAFGANWSYHLTFVHVLEPVPLLMVPVAFIGRMPWSLRLLPLLLVFLIGVQYAFANSTVPAAALHPVNGFLILLTSLFMARRAWPAARRKGWAA